MNSEEFVNAFECEVGSTMNCEDKLLLWYIAIIIIDHHLEECVGVNSKIESDCVFYFIMRKYVLF